MKTFSSKRSVGFHKQLDLSELMALKNIFPCTWFFSGVRLMVSFLERNMHRQAQLNLTKMCLEEQFP